jgi:hypothetical protein
MKSAFHQIELTQDSRYITAFQSDARIKRFTRLMFGVNSASEELQHTIRTMVSDNGPPFTSSKFKEYLKRRGIKHRRITPRWPQANAEAERFMQPLKKVIQTAFIEKRDFKEAVYGFLFTYRVTPHSSTKIAPADMMFNRKINFPIPSYNSTIDQKSAEHQLQLNDQMSKDRNKQYIDQRRHTKVVNMEPGDRVLVHQDKQNKLTSYYRPYPYIVTNRNGTMITAQSEIEGSTITRNISHYKPLSKEAQTPIIVKEEEIDIDKPESDHTNVPDQNNNHQRNRKQYPKRNRRPVHSWRKY